MHARMCYIFACACICTTFDIIAIPIVYCVTESLTLNIKREKNATLRHAYKYCTLFETRLNLVHRIYFAQAMNIYELVTRSTILYTRCFTWQDLHKSKFTKNLYSAFHRSYRVGIGHRWVTRGLTTHVIK